MIGYKYISYLYMVCFEPNPIFKLRIEYYNDVV